MTAHAVFITHRTKAGQRSRAEEVWTRIMKPAIQANSNHVAYVYTLPADEPDVIRAFQLYRTAKDAEAFLRTPEYLEYSQAVRAVPRRPVAGGIGTGHLGQDMMFGAVRRRA